VLCARAIESEENFIKLVARRYAILRVLYLDKEYSFMELSKISGVDEANLSRYKDKMKQEGLINVKTIDEKGKRNYQVISLTTDAKRIIKIVISLRGSEAALPPIPDQKYINENLELLKNSDIQSLVAYHIKIISSKYIIPPTSQLFKFLEKENDLAKIRPVADVIYHLFRTF
jgi:DNA-binding MarR family transcriptional regulator